MKSNIIIIGSVFFGIVAIALSPAAHADILTQYKFTGADKAVATTVDSNVTASDWNLKPTGSSLAAGGYGFSTNADGNEGGDPADSGSIYVRTNAGTTDSTDPSASGSGAFMEFSITVGSLGAGETLNITGFDYSIFGTSYTAGNSYYIGLYSDLTGLTGTADKISDNNNRTVNALNNASDDLSDEAALQGLTSGQVVNFRVVFGDNVTANNKITRLDNITINGSVIPEPATLGLVAAFGGAILFVRRLVMM